MLTKNTDFDDDTKFHEEDSEEKTYIADQLVAVFLQHKRGKSKGVKGKDRGNHQALGNIAGQPMPDLATTGIIILGNKAIARGISSHGSHRQHPVDATVKVMNNSRKW